MTLTLRYSCGHLGTMAVEDSGTQRPACSQCGERRVRHTLVRDPVFRGVCQGPLAQPVSLGPLPLSLKEHSHGH